MDKNNWGKSLHKVIPYLTWESLSKDFRTDWSTVRHNNIPFELHIILEGSCLFEVETTALPMKAGQAVIVRPEAFHSALKFSDPFLRFTLAFFVKDTELMTQELMGGEPYLFFEPKPEILDLCHKILAEYDSNTPFCQEMVSSLLTQFWILLFRDIFPEEMLVPKTSLTITDDVPEIDHFFSNLSAEACTRKNLAKILHCSERQVNRILLQNYGMNFRQKKQQSRIEHAKFLLRSTDKKIAEICTLVGYSDVAAFHKIFKTSCGMTPQEFRFQYRIE